MPDLDFSGLRSFVETNTYLPEFHQVQRRAKRYQRRRRIRVSLTVLTALTVVAPVAVIGGSAAARAYHPRTVLTGIAGDGTGYGAPMPMVAPAVPADLTHTLVAADGVDLEHVFGLVDVCSAKLCNMQISEVDAGSTNGLTQMVSLFRTKATDVLTKPEIVAINDHRAIISAVVNNGARQYQTLDLVKIPGGTPNTTTRPIQPTDQGPLNVVRDGANTPTVLVHQPPVSAPTLVSTTAGWWVSGTDPATGELAISVSHDEGKTWTTHPVGLLVPDGTPTLATTDGLDVYILLRGNGQLSLMRSTDSGATWNRTATTQAWPPGTGYGIIAGTNGSLLVWITHGPVTSYLRSTDHGATFVPDEGPPGFGGAILSLSNGFLALGTSPAVSQNGVIWSAAYVPYISVVS